jgi:hypothetical protein
LQELSVKVELSEEENCSNPYRVLVEKYEALLKVHQNPGPRCKSNGLPDCMSLQQELQMSAELGKHEGGVRGSKKPFTTTPTDFSEAETSSSGFSDETSNKSTQTDGRLGSLLCSIADGDDCKFSIYDDSSTFESRFHKTPEYRRLFSEIFEVLKRAAVAKDEGMELPLLEDAVAEPEPEPPTPCAEDCPSELTDDAGSVASLAVSSIASEPVFHVRTPLFGRKPEPARTTEAANQENGLGPRRHQPLEYLSIQVKKKEPEEGLASPRPGTRRQQPLEYLAYQAKRKSSAKKGGRRSSGSVGKGNSPTTPDVIPTANPRVVQLKGSGRRRFRPIIASEISDGVIWNGNTTHFYSSPRGRQLQEHQQHRQHRQRVAESPSRERSANGYKPGTAAEEVAKLRRLEMSYAEALRTPNKTNGQGFLQRRSQQ